MVEVTEYVRSSTRVFVWNEELTKKQISESEGLCVIVFRRKFTRFDKDWDEEEELLSAVRSVTPTEFINDPYHCYSGGVLKFMYALRDYTGEAAVCPTKPPFCPDLPRGLVQIKSGSVTSTHQLINGIHLLDGTCPVCFEDLQDKNKVTTTYCLHDFHTSCLARWLPKSNTCPICRAVYPLHYSPSLSNKRRETEVPVEDAWKKICLVDSKGLIVSGRKETLQAFKKPWAHKHEPMTVSLLSVWMLLLSLLL